jgi:hypothetical protein
MLLDDLSPASLAHLESALRSGDPAVLRLRGALPRGVRADELVPLLDGIEGGDRERRESLSSHLPPPGVPDRETCHVCALVPTHRRVPLGLRALLDQDCRPEVLILVNGELEIGALPDGATAVRVPWEGHAGTRNRGVRLAAERFPGVRYVLLTVDDAIPRGAGCVSAMVDALEEGGYDAVFGRQVPWPSSDPVTRERLREWTPPGRGHRRVERLDNVFALYPIETLLAHPFPDVPIAEDLHWRQGRRVGYVPGAPVLHAHERRPRELYRRTRDIHRQHIALGEPPQVPDLPHLLRALPSALLPALTAGAGEVPNQLAELLGQWRAATHPTP